MSDSRSIILSRKGAQYLATELLKREVTFTVRSLPLDNCVVEVKVEDPTHEMANLLALAATDYPRNAAPRVRLQVEMPATFTFTLVVEGGLSEGEQCARVIAALRKIETTTQEFEDAEDALGGAEFEIASTRSKIQFEIIDRQEVRQ